MENKQKKCRSIMINNKGTVNLLKGESALKNGQFSYRWTADDGKRHAIYASNLVDLRAAERKIQYINNMKADIDPYNVIVNDLHEWWKELKIGIYETTMNGYERIYSAYIQNAIGKRKLIELKHADVKRFYCILLHDRRVSIETVNRIHLVLHQVLQFGVDEGLLAANPSSNAGRELVHGMKKKPPTRFALSKYEENSFLETCKESADCDKWWPLMSVIFETGMRVSEVTGLTWEDINFEKSYIHVNHGLVQSYDKDKTLTIHSMPKTAAGNRKIPMTEKAREALLIAKRYQTFEGIESKVEIDGYRDFVFLTRESKPFGQQALNRAICRIVDKYNCNSQKQGKQPIRHFTTHIIRHTFGTRLCEKNANIKFIQYVMGHKDVQTTIDTYAHISNDIMKDGENLMNDRGCR